MSLDHLLTPVITDTGGGMGRGCTGVVLHLGDPLANSVVLWLLDYIRYYYGALLR